MYNFILFGISNDFYRHSFRDLTKMKNVIIKEDIYENRFRPLYYLYRIHTFPRIKTQFPFTSIWDKYCNNFSFSDNNPVCFVFMPKHANRFTYFAYLRKQYPNSKLIMMFRDRVDRNLVWFPNLNINKVKKTFDLVYSYNKYDCETYGLRYFNTEASKEYLISDEKSKWSDVVFIGAAKGRLNKIIMAYNKFKSAGFKTDFYIVGAPRKQIFKSEGITFARKGIPYSEMLKRTVNSKCILEISQSGEYGFTSRSQEAFMYNKLLITDSKIVKDQRFYPSDNILFYNSIEDIDPSFIKDRQPVDYGYLNDYSPKVVLEQIEKDLIHE